MLVKTLIGRLSQLTLGVSGAVPRFSPGHRMLSSVDSTKNTSSVATNIPPPPKRSSNVFALFVRDCFKRLPSDMPVRERFARAGQEWRQLSPEQKEHYQKMMTEDFVKYKNAMNDYLSSLSPDEMEQFKQQKKDKLKSRNRQRIKTKLRELKYPKRAVSSYIFFIRDKLSGQYPDGKYPPVRSPEHLSLVKEWSQQWHKLSPEERQPFELQAEADRKRYFEELEQWKQELAQPENEEKFRQLERLSKKMEVANMSADKLKAREKRQRRTAAKVIRKRLMKKAAAEAKAKKKAAAANMKKMKKKTGEKKKTSTTDKSQSGPIVSDQ